MHLQGNGASWCVVGLLVVHLILLLLEKQHPRHRGGGGGRCRGTTREGYLPASVADTATTLMMMDDVGNLIPVSWNEIKTNIETAIEDTIDAKLNAYKTVNDSRVAKTEAALKMDDSGAFKLEENLQEHAKTTARAWINWSLNPANSKKLAAEGVQNVNMLWLGLMNAVKKNESYVIKIDGIGGGGNWRPEYKYVGTDGNPDHIKLGRVKGDRSRLKVKFEKV